MKMKHLLLVAAGIALGVSAYGEEQKPPTPAPEPYIPKAVYCFQQPLQGSSPLCSTIPGNLGPDPALGQQTFGYSGILGELPKSFEKDVQSPFDNFSWQSFVALNWKAGAEKQSPEVGLQADGKRVWQTWSSVAQVFGNSPVQAHCMAPLGMQVFSMGSNGKGTPDAHNEEYIQASTGEPAIDVDGNWTLYERRLNGVEVAYLKNPVSGAAYKLTTQAGQQSFVNAGQTVNFPATTGGTTVGAIEVKSAWRILDPAKHAENATRFYINTVFLKVAPDLVNASGLPTARKHRAKAKASQQVCAKVELGLVAMHIIQKNPNIQSSNLLPQWIWSTFEHVDNAPLVAEACDPAKPSSCQILNDVACVPPGASQKPVLEQGINYSYYDPNNCPDCTNNQAPQPAKKGAQFAWNPKPPYARNYLVDNRFGSQIVRCWKNYALTDELNRQWRKQLASVNSVFQNYMLVGTQWGANVETPTPPPPLPGAAIPLFLSNTVLETYLQTAFPKDPNNQAFNTGSCVMCHSQANLAIKSAAGTGNFSFVLGLAKPLKARRPPIGLPGHDSTL